ncbi:MAG: hypothetical protein KDD25_07770, partial [Bdellovibrionales bacterium]|nr:hypothetical protein [Bdellovibrionales bacterium]
MRRFGKILFVISLGFIFVFSQGKVTRESESLSGDRSFRFVVNHLSEFLDPMNNDRLCSLPEDLALGLDKATQLMASHPARFTFVKEHPELFAKYGNSIELSANASSNWDDPIFINSNEELKTSVIEAAGLVAAILWLRANPESTDRGVIDLSGQFQSCLDTRVKAFGVRDG